MGKPSLRIFLCNLLIYLFIWGGPLLCFDSDGINRNLKRISKDEGDDQRTAHPLIRGRES